MINLILQWLRDNFRWSTTAEIDDAFDALRDRGRAPQDEDAERAAVRDTIREQRGDTSAFYIPLL